MKSEDMHPLPRLAKETVESWVREGKTPHPSELTPEMKEKAGVFVTIKKHGELRGCIGTFEPTQSSVAEEIVNNAVSSSTRDPRFLPVSTDPQCGRGVIDAIAGIREKWPDVHIGGGCSNISFGLPKRKLVNMALLAQAIYHGMDAGLIDPCTPGIMETILAAETVAGKDDFCMNYVTAMR